jgi:hypothetical protein
VGFELGFATYIIDFDLGKVFKGLLLYPTVLQSTLLSSGIVLPICEKICDAHKRLRKRYNLFFIAEEYGRKIIFAISLFIKITDW